MVGRISKGLIVAVSALLLASACGSDSGGDATCTCTCTCAGSDPTTLSGVSSAEQCRSDCKASCPAEWEAKHACS